MEEQKDIMEKKNKEFQNSLENIKFHWRSKELNTKKIFDDNNLYIFKLSINKKIKLEKKFQKEITETEPSIFIIIDNDPNYQVIAIQDYRAAFTDTEVPARILENAFAAKLKEKNLGISIRKAYRKNEFWDFIEKHPHISMIRFEFNYPNLPSLQAKLANVLKETAKSISSNTVQTEFKATQNSLVISKENEEISELNDISSKAGNPIKLRLKGCRKEFKTGQTSITIEIDELQITTTNPTFIKKILEGDNYN